MSLHLVTTEAGLQSCLIRAATDDPVVLMHAGVYAAVATGVERPMFAISNDVSALGLSDMVPDNVQEISFAQLVDLVAEHSPVVTWTRSCQTQQFCRFADEPCGRQGRFFARYP